MNAEAKARRKERRKGRRRDRSESKGRCQRCGLVVTARDGAVQDGHGAWMCAKCYGKWSRKFERMSGEVNRRVNPWWWQ